MSTEVNVWAARSVQLTCHKGSLVPTKWRDHAIKRTRPIITFKVVLFVHRGQRRRWQTKRHLDMTDLAKKTKKRSHLIWERCLWVGCDFKRAKLIQNAHVCWLPVKNGALLERNTPPDVCQWQSLSPPWAFFSSACLDAHWTADNA